MSAPHSFPVARRRLADRRRRPTNPFAVRWWRMRRKTIRRLEDRRHQPRCDQYGLLVLLLSLTIILLCVGDSLYTLMHVSQGATELNPLMDQLLGQDPLLFYVVKLLLTSLGVLLLVLYSNHPMAVFALGNVAVLYGAVLSYQLFPLVLGLP